MPNHRAATPDLIELRKKLQNKRDGLSAALNVVNEQLRSVNTTLELLGHATDNKDAREIIAVPNLEGLTQLHALLKLARANKNRVRIVTARDIFREKGLIQSEKHGYTILYNVITKSGKFKKVGTGEYELIEPEGNSFSTEVPH